MLTTLVIAAITLEAVEIFLVMLLIFSLISSRALLLSRIFIVRDEEESGVGLEFGGIEIGEDLINRIPSTLDRVFGGKV